jgi:hypothetical protein
MQSSGKKSNIKSKKLNNNISSPLISSILNYLDSEISQKISFPLKDDFISEKNILGYLKKELDSIYSFVDKGASIKLIFNPNFIFKYLETLPNYITYENMENYLIILKKYRFDFLIFQKDKNISYKLICYVDNFEINTSSKKLIDPLPDNVNLNEEIVKKSQELFCKVIKDLLSNNFIDINLLSANNFINNNYSNVNKDFNIFSFLSKNLNLNINNDSKFLLRQKIEVTNSSYLFDDNDSKINYVLKGINWKELYSSMPSFSNIKNGKSEKFITLLDKITYQDLNPKSLELDVEVNEENIKKFLEKKSKRMNDEDLKKYSNKIPVNILDLMKKYGNIMANIKKGDIENLKRFKAYSNESD